VALNVYLDASALVKLLLVEPGAETVGQILRRAQRITGSTLLYAEMVAGLAAGARAGRLTKRNHALALRRGIEVWDRARQVELKWPIARAAGALAERHGLRAADAVHLATALAVNDPRLVMVTWDRRLHEAAGEAGLAVAPAHV
jgi:predicted nucleic acid-binding protein